MSLAGTWKKVKVDNGLAFGKAIGATDEQLAKQAQATSVVTYEINGKNIKVTRVHTIAGNDLVSVFKDMDLDVSHFFNLKQLMTGGFNAVKGSIF